MGTCSKRRPRRDNVSPFEPPATRFPVTTPPAGDTERTTVLNFVSAIVCRPYGTRGLRDTGFPPLKWWAILFRP